MIPTRRRRKMIPVRYEWVLSLQVGDRVIASTPGLGVGWSVQTVKALFPKRIVSEDGTVFSRMTGLIWNAAHNGQASWCLQRWSEEEEARWTRLTVEGSRRQRISEAGSSLFFEAERYALVLTDEEVDRIEAFLAPYLAKLKGENK